MIQKQFDSKLHEKYDQSAKNAFKKYMSNNFPEDIVIENPFGIYGIDFSIEKNGEIFYLDVEVRPKWIGEDFPYNTIHLPNRKLKFANEYEKTYFLSINKNLTKGLLFRIYKTDIMVMVNNKYVSTGEEFVDIPLERCSYIIL